MPAELQDIPTIEAWLTMPLEALAEYVKPHRLALKITLDGTRRHFLLHYPNRQGEITDYAPYQRHLVESYVRLFDLFYRSGLHTLLVLNLWPPDIRRREEYLMMSLQAAEDFLTCGPFMEAYQRFNLKARLAGDYDVSPIMEPVRAGLEAVDAQLARETANGENLLLWSYCGGTVTDEMIARTLLLRDQLGRTPTSDELRIACFPHGPEKLDIFIGMGWLRWGNTDFPPVLNENTTDFYSLGYLTLDITERTWRRILYDRLFLRFAATPTDNLAYAPETIRALQNYYSAHRDHLIGLGHLTELGLWYPDAPGY